MRLLDHGYIDLIETWGSEQRIIESARMSTQKGFLGWGPKVMGDFCLPNGEPTGVREKLPEFLVEVWKNKGKPESLDSTNPYKNIKEEAGDEKLLKFLWDNQHCTPFEMAGMTIEVKAPIMVFREFMRHRTFSYNEMSARYIKLPDENYLPDIERVMLANKGTTNKQAQGSGIELTEHTVTHWLAELDAMYKHIEILYQNGLKMGIPKELARLPMAVGHYSVMRASGNLRNWLAFIKLRSSLAAQWEIRQYSNALAHIIHEKFPRTYEVAKESLGL